MNVFIPQSVQSNIEIEEIVDVRMQLIKSNYKYPIYGLIQDSLIAAYGMTSADLKIELETEEFNCKYN